MKNGSPLMLILMKCQKNWRGQDPLAATFLVWFAGFLSVTLQLTCWITHRCSRHSLCLKVLHTEAWQRRLVNDGNECAECAAHLCKNWDRRAFPIRRPLSAIKHNEVNFVATYMCTAPIMYIPRLAFWLLYATVWSKNNCHRKNNDDKNKNSNYSFRRWI